MHRILFCSYMVFFCWYSSWAGIPTKLERVLMSKEAELVLLAQDIQNKERPIDRLKAVHAFIPRLVDALKTKGSFDYTFDKLITISRLYAPDRAFRIFTWQLELDRGKYTYYGVVQMNTPKGDLQLYPLTDMADTFAMHPKYEILGADNWYGALYYKIILHKIKGKKYYTLLGYNQNDAWTNKKIIEVLSFNQNELQFGAPIFKFPQKKETVKHIQGGYDVGAPYPVRHIIEYKSQAQVSLRYIEDKKLLLYDHLKPSDDKMSGVFIDYMPDGTYEGFHFTAGYWSWVDKVYHQMIPVREYPPIKVPKIKDGLNTY